MDDPIIHLPTKVKIVALLFLVTTSAFFLGASFYFSQQTGNDEVLLISLSLAQLTITALGILFIFSFSQKSLGIDSLTHKVDQYLGEEVPKHLKNTRINKPSLTQYHKHAINQKIPFDFQVMCSHTKGTYNADYLITYKNKSCSLQINQIQSKTLAVFKIPQSPVLSIEPSPLESWFNLIESFGFSYNCSLKNDLDYGHEVLTIYLSKLYEDNYLINPTKRLQGISEMCAISRDLILLTIQKEIPLGISEHYSKKFKISA